MASAVVGALRVVLGLDSAEYDTALKRVSSDMKAWSKDFSKIGQQATTLGTQLTKTLTLPLVAVGGSAAKMAIDFESAFAGVRKTVDATEPEFAAMAQSFRNLAKDIPLSVTELAKLGEAAGALGIPKEDVVEFSRVMGLLGVTTNLTADQAADAIARIQNIFGAAGKDTDRLASTLVALGNAGASTETEIVEMAQRIAGAGHAVGMTQDQVLSFASTLASVGINAEAGGTTISRVFLKMNDAVAKGGAGLEEFARVAGMSATQFKHAFETDAASATVAVVDGLARLKASGENVNGTIEGLVGKSILMKDTLMRLTGAGELLSNQLAIGGEAWRANSALSDEAAERFKTTEAQLTLLWNRIKDVGITIGNALLPMIQSLVGVIGELMPYLEGAARFFADLPRPIQFAVVGFGALVAAIGPVLFIIGQVATAASAIAAAFTTTGIATTALSTLMPILGTAIATLTGPIGIVLAAIVGLGTAWALWGDEIKAVVSSTYTAVKTWLWDKLEPVLTPIGGLLKAIGEMFEAFGMLVYAVGVKVVGYAADIFNGIKAWLLDKLKPVIDPAIKLYEKVSTAVGVAKDLIVGFTKAIHDGVKTWLLDKFTAIVDGIRGKVEAVTGFFRDMYDKVVGHSYVPDMIDGIETQMQRLGAVMVEPAREATAQTGSAFRDMLAGITQAFQGWGSSLSGLITSHIGGPIGKGLAGIAGSIVDGAGSLLTGGISSIVSMAVGLLASGIKKLGSMIGGLFGMNATKGSREDFAKSMGFDDLAELHRKLETMGPAGERLSDIGLHVIGRKDEEGNRVWMQEVQSFLGQSGFSEFEQRFGALPGFAKGTGGKFLDFGAGTLAMLHGPEMIVPKGEGMDAGAWGNGYPRELVMILDGKEFARGTWPYLEGEARRLKVDFN